MKTGIKHVVGGVVLIFLLTGCYITKSAQVPMPVVHHTVANGQADGLIVLLPGYGDSPERFEQQGMVDVIRRIAPTFDIIAVDAHFGYYRNLSIVERLHADVLGSRQNHYQRVWMVGISLGGLGAAAYAMEYPDVVERMFLLAPYMGDEDLISEVENAGGLARWEPPNPSSIEDEEQRRFYQLWSWYKSYTQPNPTRPELLLGFGSDDKLRDGNQLLADVLPNEDVVSTPGGHKWKVWIPIFETLLQRSVHSSPQLSELL